VRENVRLRSFIGIGANLDDPVARVRAAIDALATLPDSQLAAASSLYASAPIGYADQPDFVNAAVALDTALGPRALLRELQAIESRFGRTRTFPNAPRTVDLDILLYGERVIDEPGLEIPHPRLHERAFALAPVVELDPDCVIPGRGRAAAWLARCADQRVRRL
jgi:2-amino-4-hydroxy-6-hydroxymethyldihydropteridine diphosphokinase